MRVAGFAFIGFLGGAVAGILLALLFVIIWYDVLGFGSSGGDHLAGVGTFLLLAAILGLAGGAGGAFWLGSRASAGKKVMPFGIVVLLLLLATFVLLGSLLGL